MENQCRHDVEVQLSGQSKTVKVRLYTEQNEQNVSLGRCGDMLFATFATTRAYGLSQIAHRNALPTNCLFLPSVSFDISEAVENKTFGAKSAVSRAADSYLEHHQMPKPPVPR